MKYALKNLLSLVKTEKFIFAVMLLCVFVSAWIMTFSYGLYHNYSAKLTEESGKSRYVDPTVADGMTLTRGDFVRFLSEVSPQTLDAISNIVVMCPFPVVDDFGNDGRLDMVSRFVIRNGAVIPSPYIIGLWDEKHILLSGRYISNEEEANGERVVMIDKSLRDSYHTLFKGEETAVINGEEFKIIGTHSTSEFIVPLLSIPEDMVLRENIYIDFEKPVTRRQYTELESTAEKILPGVLVFSAQEFTDEQSVLIYKNMIAVSVLIAALTMVNFAVLYCFILKKRTRTLAIMRICGCTRGRAQMICLGECCLICVPTFLLGMLTYIPLLHGVLGNMFEYIEEAYSPAVYALLFAVFVGVLLIVMGILLPRLICRNVKEGGYDAV